MVNVELLNADEQLQALARLLVEHPETRKRLKESIKTIIKRARKNISTDVHSALKNDPRNAYKAVKYAVYKQILGGNVSILASRRAGAKYRLIVKRILDGNPNQRGGNRRPRSQRTEQLDTYYGKDRGFILRFLNQGTDGRAINFKSDSKRGKVNRGSRGGDITKYGKTVNTGNRGAIPAGRQFETSSTRQMEKAAEELANSMATELEAAFYEK